MEGDDAMKDQKHPTLHDIPIGIDATCQRHETDFMSGIDVPAGRYWGAQTQRSLAHFAIGDDRMPKRVYHAYGYVKKAAALVNAAAGRLAQCNSAAIVRAADEAIAGTLDDHFPLYVWQTGSGTQSNMNVNEMPSSRAIQLLGGKDRQQVSRASERRRQYGPVVERHLPDRDAHCRGAALLSGNIDERRFDEIVDPKKMVGHGVGGS
jgi:fumarate hydratase class II